MHDRLVSKRQRDKRGTEQKERDVQACCSSARFSSARCWRYGYRSCSARCTLRSEARADGSFSVPSFR